MISNRNYNLSYGGKLWNCDWGPLDQVIKVINAAHKREYGIVVLVRCIWCHEVDMTLDPPKISCWMYQSNSFLRAVVILINNHALPKMAPCLFFSCLFLLPMQLIVIPQSYRHLNGLSFSCTTMMCSRRECGLRKPRPQIELFIVARVRSANCAWNLHTVVHTDEMVNSVTWSVFWRYDQVTYCTDNQLISTDYTGWPVTLSHLHCILLNPNKSSVGGGSYRLRSVGNM